MLILALIVVGVFVLLLSSVRKPCQVYLGIPMTGYDKQEMIQLSKMACFIARQYGLIPWSPVLEEHVMGRGKLKSDATLTAKWIMDKKALNSSFCFVNLRADEKSFGCEDEYGRHRYSEWQPSFRISPRHAQGYMSIANFQSDGVFGDMHTCFQYIGNNFGRLHQRQLFKIRIWSKSALPWIGRQLWRLFQ